MTMWFFDYQALRSAAMHADCTVSPSIIQVQASARGVPVGLGLAKLFD